MSDRDKLNCILDYLEAFKADLWTDFINGNEVTRPIVAAKESVIEEIIDYIERDTGETVSTSDGYLFKEEIYNGC